MYLNILDCNGFHEMPDLRMGDPYIALTLKDMKMSRLDLTPLFRSTVGFDHLASLVESANRVEQPAYPPYNIERIGEDEYRVSMAVAGFSEAELDIQSERNVLAVSGTKATVTEEREYLFRGIAARNFERKFQLADHVKVVGANLEDGLLHIELVREVPEAMKPRKISIGGSSERRVIEGAKSQKVA